MEIPSSPQCKQTITTMKLVHVQHQTRNPDRGEHYDTND